jgi:hypothetical protein
METDVVCSLADKHRQTFKNETDWDFQVTVTCGTCRTRRGPSNACNARLATMSAIAADLRL